MHIVRHKSRRPLAAGLLLHPNELLVFEEVDDGGPPDELGILRLADPLSLRERHPHVRPAIVVPVLLHSRELATVEVRPAARAAAAAGIFLEPDESPALVDRDGIGSAL